LPGLWALSQLRGLQALLGGWLLGTSALLAIFYWIVHTVKTFSNLPTPVAVVVLVAFSLFWGFYAAVFGWGFQAIRRFSGELWPLGLAAWFTACEYLNPQLFPFYQGVVLYQETWLFLVTAVTGVPFLSFMALLCNALLLQAWERRRAGRKVIGERLPVSLGVLVGCLVFSIGYSSYRVGLIEEAEATAETSRVALVQTNRGVLDLRKLRAKGPAAQVNDYVALSAAAWKRERDIDVFVWPEGALRAHAKHPSSRGARALVKETGAELWTGGGAWKKFDDGRRVFYNSAFRFAPSETNKVEVGPRYDKRILLPFGEFMPLKSVLPILAKIKGVGNYEPGPGVQVQETAHGRITFLICYEAIRHRYVRQAVRDGADVLVNITYDAWFGDTSNPSQHLMLSALQAAQFGVPLVRAATTGISASVDARGRLVETTPVYKRMVLTTDVKRVRVPTPYTSWGDWFAWLCVLFSCLALVRSFPSRRVEPSRGYRLATGVILVGTACIPPLSWLANPHILLGDWIVWAAAVTALGMVCVRQTTQRRNRIEESLIE